jgi:hypothetical protein
MADLAAEIPAYGALVIATRRARRAAGPLPDTRAALEAARRDFDEITSRGGRPTSFFLDDIRRENGRRIHDLADRTGDHALSVALLEVSIAWDNCWAHAPPQRGARMVDLSRTGESPADADRRRRMEIQVEVARDGQDKCQAAIARLNELERDVGS